MDKYDFDVDNFFTDEDLSKVVTIQEIEILWNKTKKVVMYAIWRDKLEARKVLTGGVWLVSYNSCIALWGQPEHSIRNWMV